MAKSSPWYNLYTSSKWRAARKLFLQSNRYCVYCDQTGLRTLASIVDHIRAHKGDMKLFWDSKSNWQPLCKPCHDTHKKREEMGLPKRQPTDENGYPPGWQ